MSNYRPITDVWLLSRPKVRYWGAYPSGFLERARAFLCAETEPLLHVCGGMVKQYPFAGLGRRDKTVDLDPVTEPDFLMDVRKLGIARGDWFPAPDAGDILPIGVGTFTYALWPAVLIDRPYTHEDAQKYSPLVHDKLPNINDLLRRCLSITKPGGSVGVLDYFLPRPPKLVGESRVIFVAAITVHVGFGNRPRTFSVFRREVPRTEDQKKRVRQAIRGRHS